MNDDRDEDQRFITDEQHERNGAQRLNRCETKLLGDERGVESGVSAIIPGGIFAKIENNKWEIRKQTRADDTKKMVGTTRTKCALTRDAPPPLDTTNPLFSPHLSF